MKRKNGATQVVEDPAEVQQKKNEAAIRLLQSWCEVDEKSARDQRETLKYLQRVLDEDRLSNRKRFA